MSKMHEYLLFVLGVALWEAGGIGRRLSAAPATARLRRWFASIGARERDLLVLVIIASLVAAVAARLLLVGIDQRHVAAIPAWFRALPFPVVLSLDAWRVPAPRLPSLLSEGLAIFGTLALAALYVLLIDRRITRTVVFAIIGGSVTMVTLCLQGHILASSDLYAYAGYARLGSAAYAPPATAFNGSFAAVSHFWSVPMIANVYGPLWLGFVHLLTGRIGDLATVIRVLQLANVATLVALAALLPVLGFGWAEATLLLLNPFVMDQFVHEGHNDLLAITLIAAAFAVVRRAPAVAVLAVSAAGLVKLPFMLIGAVVFGALRRPLALLCAAIAVGLALAGSYVFGGMAYVHALAAVGSEQSNNLALWVRLAHIVLAMAALSAIALRVLSGKRLFFAGWCMPALSATTYPWYLLWTLAYAMDDRRSVAAVLIVFPFIGVAADSIFGVYKVVTVEILAIVVFAAVVIATRLRLIAPLSFSGATAATSAAELGGG
jgi:hypothetical protein